MPFWTFMNYSFKIQTFLLKKMVPGLDNRIAKAWKRAGHNKPFYTSHFSLCSMNDDLTAV
jgi:hypothetical protein